MSRVRNGLIEIGLLLTVLVLVPTWPVLAQEVLPSSLDTAPALRFSHLTIEDGLSNSVVTAIVQDRQGFMWIGTEDGLNRYDGYRFTVYRTDPDDPNSLSDNAVTDLYEDSAGRLWVATRGAGVNCFDAQTETFTHYRHTPGALANSLTSDTILSIFEDSRGYLWFGSAPANGQLTRFDPVTETFTPYSMGRVYPEVSQRNAVWNIIEDRDGNLWLAADFVLTKFDPETETFTHYKPESDDRRLSALYLDGNGVLWIGGSEGLYRFDPQTEVFAFYRTDPPFMVDDILANDDGTMWVSTEGSGLYLFDLLAGQLGQQYRHDATDPASLSNDRLPDLYRDRAGVLWIASNSGLNLYDPDQRQFAYYRYEPDDDRSLAAGTVWGMAGDDGRSGSAGDLWLGSGMTLSRFDLASGGATRYPLSPTESDPRILPSGAIYYDPAGFVWVGNGPWLYRLDVASGEIQRYDLLTAALPGSPPLAISALIREGSTLLIAARPGGLFRFDLQSETFESYLKPPPELQGTADPRFYFHDQISTLYGDRDGAIWLGYSTGGISRLDPKTDTLRHYVPDPGDPHSIPEVWIVSMVQDRDGNLWLASRRGLIRFDPRAETFRTYAEKGGLPSAYVTAIQQDQNGALWLATTKGLSRFDPSALPTVAGQAPQTETFHNYDADDGVGSTEFSGASWQSADGRLFFGGSEGLTAFYPDQIVDNAYQPPVLLTAFYLFNEPVAIGPDSVLQQPIWETEHLTLRYDQTSISFEFAALSYAAAHKNRYRYILEGVEKEWHEVDSAHRLATYTHLPAGEHVFRVQGSNEDGVWSDEEVALTITIPLPWWEMWWFRGGALILLVGLVAGGVRWRVRSLQERGRILEAQVTERTRELAAHTERLQESEKRFRDLTELLPGAVVEMDADFTVTYMNRAGIKMFGYTQEAIRAGLNGMDVIHPQDREKATRRVARHLAGEDLPPTEYRMLRKDGTEVPVLFKASPIRWEGEIQGFRASVTDISKLKEAEKAVRQSEQQLRFITDSVPAYVAYVGLDDLRYRFVSRMFEQAYKLPRESIIGKHIKDVIGESNYQFALKHIDEVRAGRATSYENAFDIAEGKRWIEVNYVPTFDERGEPEGIAVLSFDITERKHAEEALRESQEQFALFMDMLPHGVFIKEEDSTVIYINQYIKDVLGGEHWLGRDAHAAFPGYPELAEAMMADDRNALAQGQTRVEEAMPDKDGNERVFVTTKFRISRANKPPLLGGIGLDITDRVKAERELAAALDTARQLQDEAEAAQRASEAAQRASEAASRAKSIFLANMSHELRTPLNAILGYSQLMARDAQSTPRQQEYLATIARSGEHLLGLINDVLTMSKIESGRTMLHENAFDLHHQLQGLQEMFQMRAVDKDISLLLDVAPAVPCYVYADEAKLRQVLMNLLSNAVKFTKEGGVTLRVKADRDRDREVVQSDPSLSLSPASISICFEVEDTGPGIAPEEMDTLFAPFVQTASGQESREGTGLGLPISRQFVDLMGGDLHVRSVVGQGTIFRVQIPVSLAIVDAVETSDLQSQRLRPQGHVIGIEPGQTAPDGGPFRLLIVEDKATNRQLLIELLRPFGFELRVAVNGAEGVEMWEQWHPHLVWMDMRMPVMDGYEASRQIKARAAALGRRAIIVALTASAFEEEREAMLAAGCDDFVRKPFREHKIFDVLHCHLGLRFIYETPAPQVTKRVLPQDLQAAVEKLPVAWAADLQRAAVALDVERMLALVEAVRPQTPHLADVLAQWVHDFEFDKLLALVAAKEQDR